MGNVLMLAASLAALFVAASGAIGDGIWAILLGIAGAWMAFGGAVVMIQDFRHEQNEAEFRARFPGYEGQRFPAAHLLASSWNGERESFVPRDTGHSLGVARDCLFVIRNTSNSRPYDQFGSPMASRSPPRFLTIPRAGIDEVNVRAFSDEEIAEAARDRRSAIEQVGDVVLFNMLGGSVRTIPWAALVHVRGTSGDAEWELLFGVTTEVDDGAFQAMERSADLTPFNPQLGRVAGDVASDAAGEAVDYAVGEGAATVVDGAGMLLFPQSTGSTDGRRGRALAELIARRIRSLRL